MTAQTIVTIRGHKGDWSLHKRNPDGSLEVFGPVVWDKNRGRYVGVGRCRYRNFAEKLVVQQLVLEPTT
jgi:hypothetical protein